MNIPVPVEYIVNIIDVENPSVVPGDIFIQIHAPAFVTRQVMMQEAIVTPISDATKRRLKSYICRCNLQAVFR